MKNKAGSCPCASDRVPAAERGSRLWRVLLIAAALGLPSAHAAEPGSACATHGNWIDPKSGRSIDRGKLFHDLSATPAVVLLGELHTDVDHHRWQLQTLAALHGRGRSVVIGFEAFPRRLQSVLEDWVEGKLTDEAFLTASEWRQVWGFDAGLYMPLFQFARLNRVPMIAMNVERKLVARVGKEGWEAVPASEREGLSDPAPASPAYQRELAKVYVMKKTMPPGTDPSAAPGAAPMPEPDEATLQQALKELEFKHFVEAQLTWDRAMAEALANAKRKFPEATIVGVLGAGHVEDGHGVPHQLEDLGVAPVTTFIPESVDAACDRVGTSFADVMFTLPKPQQASTPQRPRLGVFLAPGDGAPRISQIAPASVAEATGLKAGDYIVKAAGVETHSPDDLVAIVGRQAPGTWLPLSIRRDGQEMDFVAKFPPPRQDR